MGGRRPLLGRARPVAALEEGMKTISSLGHAPKMTACVFMGWADVEGGLVAIDCAVEVALRVQRQPERVPRVRIRRVEHQRLRGSDE